MTKACVSFIPCTMAMQDIKYEPYMAIVVSGSSSVYWFALVSICEIDVTSLSED